MSQGIQKESADISQDFEQLMKKNDQSDQSGTELSPSLSSSSVESEDRDQKMMQQQAMQQQMMQQQMMQQQMMQQQMLQQQKQQQMKAKPQENIKKSEPSPVKQENFTTEKSSSKSLTILGVLFALFYVFSSNQVENVVNMVPYVSTLSFGNQINLVIRAVLFVVVFFVLERYVL